MDEKIPTDHPRAASLRLREKITLHHKTGLVADAGPIAHGRGEAFDYILGEATPEPVLEDIRTAAAMLLTADHPVFSVNGNTAALAGAEAISLAVAVGAKLEVNVFYGRTNEREQQIAELLREMGAKEVLGVDPKSKVPNLSSSRSLVDRDGIAEADVVLVALEDGDRAQALLEWGKKVVSIDLNPLSRTARDANLNICDNIVRALPLIEAAADDLRHHRDECARMAAEVDSERSTARVLRFMSDRLKSLAEKTGG